MEIIERKNEKTLWMDRDVEGRKIYRVTENNSDGSANEPIAGFVYSKKAAWENR